MNCPACNQPLPDNPTTPTTPPTPSGEVVPLHGSRAGARVDLRWRDEATGEFVGKIRDAGIRQKILDAIRSGSSFADAAVFAGISRRTLNYWMQAGRQEDAPEEYRAFMVEVDEAMMAFKVGGTAQMLRIGQDGDWRAINRLMEVRFPEEWGPRQRIDHGNADGQPFMVATPTFDPERLSAEELSLFLWLYRKAQPPTHDVIDA